MFVPDNDKRKVARSYSVIAHYATNGGENSVLEQSLACGQNIDKNCGMNYFEDFLYLRGLNGTRTSFGKLKILYRNIMCLYITFLRERFCS